MAVLQRIGSTLWRNGTLLLVGDDSTDCCDCGDECSAKYIPCCLESAEVSIVTVRIDTDPVDERAVFIDREVYMHYYDAPASLIETSPNLSTGFSMGSGRTYSYNSGWEIWGLTEGDKKSFMRDMFSETPSHYPLKLEIVFRNVGGSSGKVHIDPQEIILTSKNWPPMPMVLAGFEDPDTLWTVAGDEAETTNEIDICEDARIICLYTPLVIDDYAEVFNKAKCSTKGVVVGADPVDVVCYQSIETIPDDAYSLIGGYDTESCEEEPNCDCDCWEEPEICTCLSDPDAWNQLKEGENLRYATPEQVAAASGTFAVQLQVYAFDSSLPQRFFHAYQECYDDASLSLTYLADSFWVNRSAAFNIIQAFVFYTNSSGSVFSETATLTYRLDTDPDSGEDVVWSTVGYNSVTLSFDAVEGTFTLSVNGASDTVSYEDASFFDALMPVGDIVFGGTQENTSTIGGLGCYRDISVG